MTMSRRVGRPKKNWINTGLSPLRSTTCLALLGHPRPGLSVGAECRPVTNAELRAQIVTASVGPFTVTGHGKAVDSLRRVFAAVAEHEPRVYEAVGTAGMLCCRYVRGSKRTLSNHSWGLAVDLTMNGVLQPLGSEGVQAGLLAVYRFFRAEGWYWGAGFSRNDPMHFEVADETLRKWLR